MTVEQRFLVIDDHDAILAGTLPALRHKYPQANIAIARTAQAAEQHIQTHCPDFAIIDLRLPKTAHSAATADVGLALLGRIMQCTPAPNIMVLSIDVQPLVRMKAAINTYEGGFVAIDKASPIEDMLRSAEIALRGSTYLPPDVRSRPEYDPKWVQVLQLKYHEGLSDKAIARQMGISDRTVRNYWVRIQDTLGIADDPDQDLRVQIQIVARKAGLIN